MDHRVHPDSFAFPLHCQQLIFSDDPTRRGWKIVCKTDVRGRRTLLHHRNPVPDAIIVGNDDDFQDLQPQILETDPIQTAAPTGRSFVTAATETNNRAQIEED
jgi:hypothetical protein